MNRSDKIWPAGVELGAQEIVKMYPSGSYIERRTVTEFEGHPLRRKYSFTMYDQNGFFKTFSVEDDGKYLGLWKMDRSY